MPSVTERREAALERARRHVIHVLTSMNDMARTPEVRREVAAGRQTLPSVRWSPEDQAQIDADEARGVKAARRLLSEWNVGAVRGLIDKLEVVGAAYHVQDDGTVQLEPRQVTGPSDAVFALALAEARSALHSSGLSLRHLVKQCENPTCKKWFFDDGERGRRVWCCTPCGAAHRQLKFKENFEARRRRGDFEERRTPCSRHGCEA